MPIQAGSRALASDVVTATKKIIARGRRITDSTATTSIVGVLRLDDIPITGGRIYKIFTSDLHLDSSVVDDHIEAQIRYTTDGSTPSTSSSVLPGARAQARQSVSAAFGEDRTINAIYAPATDETLSLLLCVRRDTGTGSVGIIGTSDFIIDMWVEDGGEDPGDTGVDI